MAAAAVSSLNPAIDNILAFLYPIKNAAMDRTPVDRTTATIWLVGLEKALKAADVNIDKGTIRGHDAKFVPFASHAFKPERTEKGLCFQRDLADRLDVLAKCLLPALKK